MEDTRAVVLPGNGGWPNKEPTRSLVIAILKENNPRPSSRAFETTSSFLRTQVLTYVRLSPLLPPPPSFPSSRLFFFPSLSLHTSSRARSRSIAQRSRPHTALSHDTNVREFHGMKRDRLSSRLQIPTRRERSKLENYASKRERTSISRGYRFGLDVAERES